MHVAWDVKPYVLTWTVEIGQLVCALAVPTGRQKLCAEDWTIGVFPGLNCSLCPAAPGTHAAADCSGTQTVAVDRGCSAEKPRETNRIRKYRMNLARCTVFGI